MSAPTRYLSAGWLGMTGPALWLLTSASPSDEIAVRSWELVCDGALLHQLVALYTERPDLSYALAGTSGDITQVVVRGPVRVEVATPAGVMVIAGSDDGGDWSGHVVVDPILNVTLVVCDAAGSAGGDGSFGGTPEFGSTAESALPPQTPWLQPPPEVSTPPPPVSAPPAETAAGWSPAASPPTGAPEAGAIAPAEPSGIDVAPAATADRVSTASPPDHPGFVPIVGSRVGSDAATEVVGPDEAAARPISEQAGWPLAVDAMSEESDVAVDGIPDDAVGVPAPTEPAERAAGSDADPPGLGWPASSATPRSDEPSWGLPRAWKIDGNAETEVVGETEPVTPEGRVADSGGPGPDGEPVRYATRPIDQPDDPIGDPASSGADVRWSTSPNPPSTSSSWASEATSVVPLVDVRSGASEALPGEPHRDEPPVPEPAPDAYQHTEPQYVPVQHNEPTRPTWSNPAPVSPSQAPPQPVAQARPSGLISDVSWADTLVAPADHVDPAAARRPALDDMSWTSEQHATPRSAEPPAGPPTGAVAGPAVVLHPPPAAPYTPSAPAPPTFAAPPPAPAPPVPLTPAPSTPAPPGPQAFNPPVVAPPSAVPTPAFSHTAQRQDLDITIWRPIAETSVMTGGSLTVTAVRCVDGHLNPLIATSCRVCAKSVPPQSSIIVPRPPLGTLRMSTSDTIRLDHGVIFGRDPGTPDATRQDQPYFVKLTDKDISRRHLEVVLDGWDVVAVDLNSSNGSAITLPGSGPEVIPGGARRLLLPGTIVHLSDTISFVFEVTP